MGLRLTHKVGGCNWVGFGSSQCVLKPTIYWVSSSISRIRSPAGMAPNPQFTEFGARFDDLLRKPTRYPRRMCRKPRTAWCKIENLEKWFEQRTRAPNSENCGFEAQFAQICFRVEMARNPQFTGFGARFARFVVCSWLVSSSKRTW